MEDLEKLSQTELLRRILQMQVDVFGDQEEIIPEALTFDDVLLEPKYSEVLPREVSTRTRLTKGENGIFLNIPFLSAAMDKVTESKMAIQMGLYGGLGIIHKNMTIEAQAAEVSRVKRHRSDIVTKPFTLSENQTVADANKAKQEQNFSTFPIVNSDGMFVGLVTGRDLSYSKKQPNAQLKDVMLTLKEIKVAYATDSLTVEAVSELFQKYRVTKLPVLKSKDEPLLVGIYFQSDVDNLENYPDAARDKKGRLLVGAAVGVGQDTLERISALVKAGVDVVCVDSAHGHSKGVIDTVVSIKKAHPQLPVIAGNIVTKEGAVALIEAGADALKVGVGPGSICTTRDVAGVGVAQFTAIKRVVKEARKHNVPVIGDGGITKSGSVVKAIAVGACAIMGGSMFAGTDEAPGEKIQGPNGQFFKEYRGMGSIEAMTEGSADRYLQAGTLPKKLVAEGVNAKVPYKGPVGEILSFYVGGLRQGMGYQGAKDITTMQLSPKFTKVSVAGLYESGVHDVIQTK